MIHNVILIFVFRLSISRQTQGWRNINNFLTITLLISSLYGVIFYIWPIYYADQPPHLKQDATKSIKEDEKAGLTL